MMEVYACVAAGFKEAAIRKDALRIGPLENLEDVTRV